MAARHLQSGFAGATPGFTGATPGFTLPIVQHLDFGQSITGTVERQHAHFFRITVSHSDLDKGVIVSCSSVGGDKFKLVFFDREGSVSMVEESQVSSEKNNCTYISRIRRIRIAELNYGCVVCSM
jgi:hypothetical protein